MTKGDIRKNASGYSDPTAYAAIRNVSKQELEESGRFHDLLDTLFYITELAGFEIEGRIVLKDTKTGRVWR